MTAPRTEIRAIDLRAEHIHLVVSGLGWVDDNHAGGEMLQVRGLLLWFTVTEDGVTIGVSEKPDSDAWEVEFAYHDLLTVEGAEPRTDPAAEIAHLRDLNAEALQRIDGLVADLAAYVPAVDFDGELVMETKTSDGRPCAQFWNVERYGQPPKHYKPLYRKVTPGGAE